MFNSLHGWTAVVRCDSAGVTLVTDGFHVPRTQFLRFSVVPPGREDEHGFDVYMRARGWQCHRLQPLPSSPT